MLKMLVLVTGGAGYIGSHTVKLLLNKGYEVIVVDNLSTGCVAAIDKRVTFYNIDIRDTKALNKVFLDHKIELVIHFAAKLIVPESITNPLDYYDNNVNGTNSLLRVMKNNNINKIVFSSTAAVYGLLDKGDDVIYETDPTVPINPYGQTKLVAEDMIKWANSAHDLQYVIFRYFNVAGSCKLGCDPKSMTALIPKVLSSAMNKNEIFHINGNDYNTKDGTCIRDYIHVEDLAEAHVLAAEKMYANKHVNGIYNLGNGKGFTVLEIYKKAQSITGLNIPMEFGPRRCGDPVISVASSKKAKELLGWKPKYTTVEDIIRSAWVSAYGESEREKKRIYPELIRA